MVIYLSFKFVCPEKKNNFVENKIKLNTIKCNQKTQFIVLLLHAKSSPPYLFFFLETFYNKGKID